MGTRTRETTFRQDDTREKREEDVYKILIVNCKSSPNTVLFGYHALESPPFYSLQKLCDNYSYCDILGGWVGLCVYSYTPFFPLYFITQVLKVRDRLSLP